MRVGALQGYAPDVKTPALGTTLVAFLGARLSYTVGLTRMLALRPSVEAAIPLVRTSLVIDKGPVWTAPPVTAALGLSLLLRFQ